MLKEFIWKHGVKVQVFLGIFLAIVGTDWRFWLPSFVLLASAAHSWRSGQPL